MVSIAREILLHDKMRFLITVFSLGFAILMAVYDIGMFFGVTGDSVALVDRAGAELWVSAGDQAHLNTPSFLPKSALRRARHLAGVEQACALDFSVGNLKINDTRPVQVLGIDPTCALFQPWDIQAGDIGALRRKDTLVVDDLALRGANLVHLGDIVELNGQEVRLVAITHGNKSFSSPQVYTNLQTFERLTGQTDQVNFVAIRLKPGADIDQIRHTLLKGSADLEIIPAGAFRSATIMGLISQGVGMIFVIVFVGLVVGMLIITLTMYTATMEMLRDFAILKALGATQAKIWGIVLEQAVTKTAVGFAVGMAATLGVNYLVETVSGITGRFPPLVVAACFALMVLLAIFGSLISIRKATQVDPAIVFRA